MSSSTDLRQSPMCPKCRCLASLRLRASLPESDGFPQVQCLECSSCGNVMLVERGLGERSEAVEKPFIRIAA
jgi:hypothetical protein